VVSAFTATATPLVREDIVRLLKLRNPAILVSGLDRKNLHFAVDKPKDKPQALLEFLKDKKGKSGIVYCSTRNSVEEVCNNLNQEGYPALRYHAGLDDQERKFNQDEFLFDRVQLMVATNAFGMGIDKSNVSFVVHYNMPQNIESYYQEAGRAGRDGEPAECLMLYGGQDVRTNLWLIENGKGMVYPDSETESLLKERDRLRLREMTFYCHTNNCLRSYILKYFGEQTNERCGNCSNCNNVFNVVNVTEEAKKIMSCVYRTNGRYGVKTVIDILRGSKKKRIIESRLDRLSTYGISNLKETTLRDIINSMILDQYLLLTDDEFPLLKLNHRAAEVLKDNHQVEVRMAAQTGITTEKEGRSISQKVEPGRYDEELFNILRKTRMEIATRQQVPAFVVFSDSALIDMCRKLPMSKYEFLQVNGVGSIKMDQYGDIFVSTIKNYVKGQQQEIGT
jgi:ATP-dependent DNA helicase RecQ